MAYARFFRDAAPVAALGFEQRSDFGIEVDLHTPMIAKFCGLGKQPIASDRADHCGMTHSNINAVVARALRYYMDKGALSEAQLARKAGLSPRTVGNFLQPQKRLTGAKGKEPSGKLTELAMIAAALEIDVGDLVADLTAEERETRRRLHMAAVILQTGEAPSASVDKKRPPALA